MTLSDIQQAQIVERVARELVSQLLAEHGAELALLTPAQVCGLLNVSQPPAGIGYIDTTGSASISGRRYRIADVRKWQTDRLVEGVA